MKQNITVLNFIIRFTYQACVRSSPKPIDLVMRFISNV